MQPSPSDYYFSVKYDLDMDVYVAYITPRDIWDAEHRLDDRGMDVPGLPSGFYDVMEACYEFVDAEPDDARNRLRAAGFIENTSMP